MRKIYNEKCYSIYTDNVSDDSCLKRWFEIFDYKNDEWVNVGICAEYFRLVLKTKTIEGEYLPLEKTIDEVIGSLFSDFWISHKKSIQYFFSSGFKNRSHKYFNGITVRILLCDRPYIVRNINIIDALKLAHELNYPSSLLRDISYSLIDWAKSNTLNKEKKIKDLIRKAFGASFYKDRISVSLIVDEINFTELIIYLLNEQTNDKQQKSELKGAIKAFF